MDELLDRNALTLRGLGRRAIERCEQRGELVKVGRNAWVENQPADRRARYLLRIQAAARAYGPDAVVSHLSAAAVWGLPLPEVLDDVWLTRVRRGGGHLRGGVRLVGAPVDDREWTVTDGLRVTTLDRTVVDVARACDHVTAVMVADAVLRRGLRPGVLRAAVDRADHWPGVARARTVVGFADGRAESPYESWMRIRAHEHGLVAVVPQYTVIDQGGGFVARLDLGDPELRLALEYDGEDKYDRLAAPGTRPGEVFHLEKGRDERLRNLGWVVLHLGKRDIRDRRLFDDKVGRAAARASGIRHGA